MRTLKFLLISLALIGMTGCSCKKRAVDPEENIALAEAGKELVDINYGFDSYALSDAGKTALDHHAEWLNARQSIAIQIEGHCDERGTNEYNMALGAKRARTAYDYLRAKGVAEARMSTISYGEELPLDPRSNEAAWAKNRRAHFKVSRR